MIARVTGFLFEHQANIEALEEQVTRGQFSLTLQASWHRSDLNSVAIRAGFSDLAAQLGKDIRIRFTEPGRQQRFAIMVTKESHFFEALTTACRNGGIKAVPVLVIGNRPDLKPLASRCRLPFVKIAWQDRTKAEARALQILEKHEIDFVVLARFRKILSPNFVWRYKIINIHPSLLPSFPGPQAYRQAYEGGVKIWFKEV